MIEIILLIFLCKKIGALAITKGLPAGRWKLYLVLGWIFGEILGAIIAIMLFGKDNLFSCLLIAIGFAATSYFLILNYLQKLPDVVDENEIGRI